MTIDDFVLYSDDHFESYLAKIQGKYIAKREIIVVSAVGEWAHRIRRQKEWSSRELTLKV